MANPNDAVFEIDAGKVLAKLHLAGQSQANNAIVVNTAIKNPSKSAKPESPGNVEFDLENKTGLYQLAIIRPLEYLVPIDPNKNKNYVKAKSALDKFMKDHEKDLPKKAEHGKKEDNKQQDKNKDALDNDKEQQKKNEATSLTDKDAKQKTAAKESTQMKSFLEYLAEANDEDKKQDDKLLNLLEKLQEPLIKLYDEYGLEKYEKAEDKDTKKVDYDASAKSFETALTEENKKRIADKKKLIDECKKAATDDLKTYFLNFAGKENQAKIKPTDIVAVNATVENHIADPKDILKSIKDYKLAVDDIDKKILQNQDKLQNEPAKISKLTYKHDIALVISYEVEIETM